MEAIYHFVDYKICHIASSSSLIATASWDSPQNHVSLWKLDTDLKLMNQYQLQEIRGLGFLENQVVIAGTQGIWIKDEMIECENTQCMQIGERVWIGADDRVKRLDLETRNITTIYQDNFPLSCIATVDQNTLAVCGSKLSLVDTRSKIRAKHPILYPKRVAVNDNTIAVLNKTTLCLVDRRNDKIERIQFGTDLVYRKNLFITSFDGLYTFNGNILEQQSILASKCCHSGKFFMCGSDNGCISIY